MLISASQSRGARTIGADNAIPSHRRPQHHGSTGVGCGAAGAPTSIAATFGPYDRATVDRLVAQGLARSEALILAMTKVTVASADAQSVRLVEAFPTGDTADVTITASPAAADRARPR
jgi:hypothetical protein